MVEFLKELMKDTGFKNIMTKIFDHYDRGHEHWHKILEITAEK